jgi:tripartite-type tricarboxylate transporter receptor subunit TctC
MKLPRRQFLRLAFGIATVPAASQVAWAQTYPMRPITMIVPFAAGGSTDVAGRIVAQGMREALGQPIIIENIGAADGTIAVGRLAHARPDGYTIDMGALTTHVLPGAMYRLQYDLLNDFEPITPAITAPYLLYARTAIPSKDLMELINLLSEDGSAQRFHRRWLGRLPRRNRTISEGPFNSEVQRLGLLSYARIFFI